MRKDASVDPTGKSLRLLRNAVKPSSQKYFASVFQNCVIVSAHPASIRGAFRHRHERGKRDAVDALVSRGERRKSGRAKSCGPVPPTLGSSLLVIFRQATVAKRPGTPGERADRPLTPIAQGRPACFGGPVVTNACAYLTARAAMGAQNTRPSLRPLSFRGVACTKPGRIVPRERETASPALERRVDAPAFTPPLSRSCRTFASVGRIHRRCRR